MNPILFLLLFLCGVVPGALYVLWVKVVRREKTVIIATDGTLIQSGWWANLSPDRKFIFVASLLAFFILVAILG